MALMQEEDMRAVQVALAIISETKREPGETAFPDLGTILAVVNKAEESWWRRPERDPPADREPVYATTPSSPPVMLTGDRLRLAVLGEIETLQKDFRVKHPTVPMYDMLEVLAEPERSRYIKLTGWAGDFRTYPLKKALPRPLDDAGGAA